jgi:hypothetical protein
MRPRSGGLWPPVFLAAASRGPKTASRQLSLGQLGLSAPRPQRLAMRMAGECRSSALRSLHTLADSSDSRVKLPGNL